MSKMPGDRAWDAADRHRRAADALRARLAAAEAREAIKDDALRRVIYCARSPAAVSAAEAALATSGSALAQAIEGVVTSRGSTEDLCKAVAALRDAWGQR